MIFEPPKRCFGGFSYGQVEVKRVKEAILQQKQGIVEDISGSFLGTLYRHNPVKFVS